MKCNGQDAISGERVVVEWDEGDAAFRYVDSDLAAASGDDAWLAPGFIDLQVNGFAGVDFNSPSATHEEIAGAITAIFSTGVTRFFPTVITGEPQTMLGALRNLAAARESLAFGRAMEAFHVEGPHIAPEDGPRGAHPKQWVRPPDIDEFQRKQEAAEGNIRLVTIAPEWPGTPAFIEQLSRQGVVASIGHTSATPRQIRDAVSAGARMSTHLGNAGANSLPRRDNYLYAQLAEDRLASSFIVDGHHLSDAFLKIALRAKGIERSILVTDAAPPVMCSPGPYMLGGVEVELRDDERVTVRGGERLAGSALRMHRAISNVMRITDVSLAHAIIMCTSNAARVGRIPGRLRGIRPGERADLVRFKLEDGRMDVLETYFSGRLVYSSAVSAQ